MNEIAKEWEMLDIHIKPERLGRELHIKLRTPLGKTRIFKFWMEADSPQELAALFQEIATELEYCDNEGRR